jgi:23S rRNA (cytosine1962-C5)-methyltransferase
MPTLYLKPGRHASLLRRHPWIYSGAVGRIQGEALPGDTVEVRSAEGDILAWAGYSPASQIRARVWSFDPDERIEADFFRRRIQTALAVRSCRPGGSLQATEAGRLINAESDGLPGLIVDRYAGVLVVQFLSAGVERWRETISQLLREETGLASLYERSDVDARELEGLPPRCGVLAGDPPARVVIQENGLSFAVDLVNGHKTGFYLDQRENRLRVRQLSAERDVLDCFCYTGGFSANALAGGARSVLSVDASAAALALCQENISSNGLPADRHTVLEGDVFQLLRKFRDEGRSFDMIVLDPPKFAPTAAQVGKAARGYKDINLLGFKLLRPGGILVTFSCSGGVDAALFQKIVASACLDAGGMAQIVEHLAQAMDHPVALNFPEGSYLKGLVCLRTSSSDPIGAAAPAGQHSRRGPAR